MSERLLYAQARDARSILIIRASSLGAEMLQNIIGSSASKAIQLSFQ
jgi:hypothetical protein